MTVLDILVPVLMVIGAIAVVALVYLVFTMLKDRGAVSYTHLIEALCEVVLHVVHRHRNRYQVACSALCAAHEGVPSFNA